MLRSFTQAVLQARSCISTIWAGDISAHRSSVALAVLVDDRARLPEWSLQAAQGEAGGVFRRAGIEIRWGHCSFSAAQTWNLPGCQRPLDVPTVIARILSHKEAKRWRVPGLAMGFYWDSDVYILLPRVQGYAKQHFVQEAVVLGHALAHEIGHGLLGAGHSASGIMRSHLSREEWRLAERGQLTFTPDQAARLRDWIATHGHAVSARALTK